MASRRALLIGINRYRIPGADLRGCVNDVESMASVLEELCGFRAADVETITDFAATKKAMQSGIRDLVKGGRKGDVLFLHYSGHGSNVPDDDGDEADHRDEILCPTDLDWKDPFRDDWLRKTFDGLRPGVSLTVVMDCCHSGTNTRAVLPFDAPVIPRYLPSPWDIMAAESGRKLKGRVTGRLRRTPHRKSGPDVVTVTMPETLIAGCRDTQTSADAFIDGRYSGALTWSLACALRATSAAISYRALHARSAALLGKGRYDQVPQLEGRKARLDARFLSPES